jgi:hypothetical protein
MSVNVAADAQPDASTTAKAVEDNKRTIFLIPTTLLWRDELSLIPTRHYRLREAAGAGSFPPGQEAAPPERRAAWR